MPPRNNQINWEAITGNVANMTGLNPAMEAQRRRSLMAETEHQDNRALIAAKLSTEGMRPAEIAATIAKLNSDTGYNTERTRGARIQNDASVEIWNDPRMDPARQAIAGLNPDQIMQARRGQQQIDLNQRVADEGIGDATSGPNYRTLAALAAAGGNPSAAANVFHNDPNRAWYSVNGSLVNPNLSGAVGRGQQGGAAPAQPPSNIVMPSSGLNYVGGQPVFPQAAQPSMGPIGDPNTLAGIITPPARPGSAQVGGAAGAAQGPVKASDFNTYEGYFRTALERMNRMSDDGKSYEQILRPEQADSIAGLAHDLMANAAQEGISHPQQALERAYEIATGSRMPTAEDNEVVTHEGFIWDSTETQGRNIVGYDQSKVDQYRANLRDGTLRSLGVDNDLISKAIGSTATPGTTGMLPGGASTPSSIASQVSQPAKAAQQPQPKKGEILKANQENLKGVNASGEFSAGGVDFVGFDKFQQQVDSGKVQWDPAKPLLISPKDGSGAIIQAYWNPNRKVFQDAPPVMEGDDELANALSHLQGKDDLDALGGMSGSGKPISSLFRPVGAYEDSLETALQTAVQRGLLRQEDYETAAQMDRQYDPVSGKGAGGLRATSGSQTGKGMTAGYYRANLLQSVLPDLMNDQRRAGLADVRIGGWAQGKFNSNGIPTDALKVAEQMGIDKSRYGIPDDPVTGIGAMIRPIGYSEDRKAIESGLAMFFSDVMAGNASYSDPKINIAPGGKFEGEVPYRDGTMPVQAAPRVSMPQSYSQTRQNMTGHGEPKPRRQGLDPANDIPWPFEVRGTPRVSMPESYSQTRQNLSGHGDIKPRRQSIDEANDIPWPFEVRR